MIDDSEEHGPRDVADGDDQPVEDAYADEYDDEDAFAEDDDAFDGDENDLGVDGAVGTGPAGPPVDNLRHLVHFLASNLVDDPENVVVEAEQRGPTISITLRVPEDELGKVIGRQGRIARAIRTVLTIAGSRQNVRASLDIEG
jgi:predicted RNA-binding protein YlqC (UPF0109 family)